MLFYTDGTGSVLPQHKTELSVGADLKATESCWIMPFSRKVIGTGLYVCNPDASEYGSYPGKLVVESQVRTRSGLAAKKGLFVLNSPGTIEEDYPDEIKVILANFSFLPRKINVGDRIAQIVTAKAFQSFKVSKKKRTGGLGSTGK